MGCYSANLYQTGATVCAASGYEIARECVPIAGYLSGASADGRNTLREIAEMDCFLLISGTD